MIKKLIILGLLILSNNPVLAGFWTSGKITTVSTGGTSTVRDDGFDMVIGTTDSARSSFRATWTILGTATLWTKIPTLATGTTTIYVYYNNPVATDTSNFSMVFTKDFEDTGLKGLWHLDEGTGTTTVDSSGNGNTGTLVNGAIWQATDGGQWDGQTGVTFNTGSHLSFDGNDDYVSIPESTIWNGLDALTIETWINASLIDSNSRNVLARDLSNYKWIHFLWEGGTLVSYVRTINGVVSASSSNLLTTNTWYHLVTTYDKALTTERLKVYVNAVKTGSAAGTDAAIMDGDGGVGIGRRYTSTSFDFSGKIDEVRIYNRSLSQAEIQAHYERRKYAGTGVTISYGAEQNNPGTIYPAYSLRRPITINNTGTSILTNFQIEIPLRIGSRGISILD